MTTSQNQFPSFFISSCTETGSENCLEEDLVAPNDCSDRDTDIFRPQMEKRSGGEGGFTCCIPGCFSNSKRDNHLSFYDFLNGESSEKQLSRKKWIHAVSQTNFKPTRSHRFCSEHFEGGFKSYLNNIPTITPKTLKQMKSKPRSTTKARNWEFVNTSRTEADMITQGDDMSSSQF